MLGEATGAEVDRAGRVTVEPDLTLPGHPEVLALGDMVRVRDAGTAGCRRCPGSRRWRCRRAATRRAPCAHRLEGRPTRAFHYVDKGNLATIGRGRAVGDLKGVHLSGLLGVADLAGRAPLLPRGLPEPGARLHPLGGELRDPRARRAAHHLPGAGGAAAQPARRLAPQPRAAAQRLGVAHGDLAPPRRDPAAARAGPAAP